MADTQQAIDTTPIAAPLLLGYMFNWALYGILSVQVYIYHLAFKKDGKYTRSFVYALYAVETAQTIIATNDAFNTYARNFGNIGILVLVQNVWLSVPVLTGIVSGAVQLYYAKRIYSLSDSLPLGLLVATIALLQGSSAIATGAKAHQIGNFVDLEAKSYLVTSIWLIGSAACDVLIAGSMTFLLVRRDTGMHRTHEIITRLVRLIVETGSLTATTAIVDAILFLAQPGQSYHVCAALTLAKLYSNSLLVLFNSRSRVVSVQSQNTTSQGSYGFSNMHRRGFTDSRSPPATTLSTTIHVHEESFLETDSIPMDSITNLKSKGLTDSAV